MPIIRARARPRRTEEVRQAEQVWGVQIARNPPQIAPCTARRAREPIVHAFEQNARNVDMPRARAQYQRRRYYEAVTDPDYEAIFVICQICVVVVYLFLILL